MKLLCLDVGSSSVKAGIVADGKLVGTVARAAFKTQYADQRAEVDATHILRAIRQVIDALGSGVKQVDGLAHASMAPSWLAMDKRGKALTPIITHQDRRAPEESAELTRRIGAGKHLSVTGNQAFPGGISSTTALWMHHHKPSLLKRADLIGHFSTYFIRQVTGSRVTDPSNASFMGLYNTMKLSGWNEHLCEVVGVRPDQLPEVRQSHEVAGRLLGTVATKLGLVEGLPVAAGCMDTSAAMLLAGANPGQLLNVCGSTDVLAVCTDKPVADEKLLTRGLGIGLLWMQVSTLAAAGSALEWARKELFSNLEPGAFGRLLRELANRPMRDNPVIFRNYLAGDRMSLEQKQGAFEGLTLGTNRRQMLDAIIQSLARDSAARIGVLAGTGVKFLPRVMLSGGVQDGLATMMHSQWPGRWRYRVEQEATLRGLGLLPMDVG